MIIDIKILLAIVVEGGGSPFFKGGKDCGNNQCMKSMESNYQKKLAVIDLGLQPYRPVWKLQQELQRKRIEQKIPDTLIFVEHTPVYTIGKNGSDLHVIASSNFLHMHGIEVVQVDRGGDVTYHGPGQLVGYPIFDLHQHKQSISWYMRNLEEVFIEVIKKYNLQGERSEGYTGVWIKDEKITALGVRISHWVTMHGFAFNVNTNLSHFGGIIPCGIFQYGVTSLQKVLNQTIDMEEVKQFVIQAFQDVFNFSKVEAETDTSGSELMLKEKVL
jgi:lipoyl(octanoyl) transferase